jgi:hypothetical protein
MPQASGTLTWSFVALAVLLAGALVAACYWVERRDARRRVRRALGPSWPPH